MIHKAILMAFHHLYPPFLKSFNLLISLHVWSHICTPHSKWSPFSEQKSMLLLILCQYAEIGQETGKKSTILPTSTVGIDSVMSQKRDDVYSSEGLVCSKLHSQFGFFCCFFPIMLGSGWYGVPLRHRGLTLASDSAFFVFCAGAWRKG